MGVAGDKYALGYFGYAYYKENQSRLKVVPIDGGDGPVKPTETSINDGSYKPLSRPIFIYVSNKGSQKPEVKEFVRFYLKNAAVLSKEVGYIPLPDSSYENSLKAYDQWSNTLIGENSHGVKKASLR